MSLLDRFPYSATSELFSQRVLEFDQARGWARIGFEAGPAFLNPGGAVQGGILTAMLDDTMGPALWFITSGEAFPVTIDVDNLPARPPAGLRYPAPENAPHAWQLVSNLPRRSSRQLTRPGYSTGKCRSRLPRGCSVDDDPCWRMITGAGFAADLAIHTGADQSLGGRWAQQQVVKPQAGIALPTV